MRILFVNHTFPGDLGPLLAAFAAQPGHEILFASCRGRRDFRACLETHLSIMKRFNSMLAMAI